MFPLRELVGVDRRFEKSINLQLDLNDLNKVNGYIPTQSSVAILKEYLNNILEDKEKASILIGPYGKGKSHLLLVLLAILNMEKASLKTIIKKISFVDEAAGELISSICKQKLRFLPVVISASDDDLNQAFLLGLHEALKQFGIKDITINSFYTEALRVLEGWEKDFPDTYSKFEEELSKRKIHINVFLKQLREYREDALSLFKDIYPFLTSGSIFQPMVHVEIKDLYEEVCAALEKTGQFSGIYIIFDEFSKYIEGHKKETFAQDMKKIQDLCELSNHSKKGNIFITFVAHKSMKEYGKSLDKSIINSFRGVEGRLCEKLFVISSQNNYELLTNTIVKKKKFNEICELPKIKEIHEKTYQMDYFKTFFMQEEYEKYIANGCYPLTPLAAYMLLRISEKVAQNERTIFTFMTGDEPGSLYRILKENKGTDYFVGADKIYDYFQSLFKDNLNLTRMYNEWLKAKYALTLVADENEKKIIKTLALFLMLKDSDEIVPNDKNIRLALGMENEIYQSAVANLKTQNVILWRGKYDSYNFKNQIGIDLESEIQKKVSKLVTKLQVTEELEKISVLDFVLPRAYNQRFTMTRFYRYMFMEEAHFEKLGDGQYLFQELTVKNKFADGIILLILKGEDGNSSLTEEHVNRLQDERLVVLNPNCSLGMNKQLLKLKAIEQLLKDQEFTENNQVLIQEMNMYREDLAYEINQKLLKTYDVANGNCSVMYCDGEEKRFDTETGFNNFLGKIFEKYYTNTPRVNNELLNVRNIGKQYRKARNTIVSKLLENEDLSDYIKGTSPEAIIYRAAFVHTGIANADKEIEPGCKEILDQIQAFIKSATGKKVAFDGLMKLLTGKNYGAREGILPLFMAVKFASITSIPFIYLKNKEVELNAETLENLCEKPSEYFLYVERESGEKEQYLQDLEELFVTEMQSGIYNRRKRVCIIADKMQAWYRSLPQVSLHLLQGTEDEVKQVGELCKILRKIEINPRELLFEKIPELIQKDIDWKLTAETVASMKVDLDASYQLAVTNIVDITKETFEFSKGDNLCAGLMEWYTTKQDTFEKYVFSDKLGNLRDYLKTLDTYDEQICIKRLTKIVLDIYLEDFTKQHAKDYEMGLVKLLEEIANVEGQSESDGSGTNKITFFSSDGKKFEKSYAQTEEDSTSYFLKNAITTAIEEFGDSLDQNQKLAVLIQTIEELF